MSSCSANTCSRATTQKQQNDGIYHWQLVSSVLCTVQSVHCIGQVTLNTTSFTFLTGPESWALVCHRIPLLNQHGMEAFYLLYCMELVIEKDFRNLHAFILIKCVSEQLSHWKSLQSPNNNSHNITYPWRVQTHCSQHNLHIITKQWTFRPVLSVLSAPAPNR